MSICQTVLDALGFYVLAFVHGGSAQVGTVVEREQIDSSVLPDSVRLVVIGEATVKDWKNQHVIFGQIPICYEGATYWKTVAE